MLTLWQNSKKCSVTNPEKSIWILGITLLATALLPATGWGNIQASLSERSAPLRPGTQDPQPNWNRIQLREDLLSFAKGQLTLDKLHQKWTRASSARDFLTTLSTLCEDATLPEEARFSCVLEAVRAGGTQAFPILTSGLTDRSWLVRVASLRGVRALHEGKKLLTPLPDSLTQSVRSRMQDPALAVRREAIETLSILPLEVSEPLLRHAVEDPTNYHSGRPIWIPQRALQILTQSQSSSARSWLKDFASRTSSAELKKIAMTQNSK